MDLVQTLHPILSGFPATLLVLLLFTECLLLWKKVGPISEKLNTVRCFLVITFASSVIWAFLSGYVASSYAGELSKDAEALISNHHSFGKLLLVNSLLFASFYWLSRVAEHGRTWFNYLYFITLFIQVILSFTTARKGGELVFEHGVGVKRPPVPSSISGSASNNGDRPVVGKVSD